MGTNYNPNEQALALHGDRVNTETKEVQARLLEILKVIDRVCKDHGLTYYLLCGTMLGAVRHGGFIPWDDDADVGMPRDDYEKLLAHADEWMPEGYEVVSGGRTAGYPYPFARVQETGSTYRMHRSYDFVGGLPIDLFPLDGMVEDCSARRSHYKHYKFWWKMLYFTHTDPYKHGRGLRSMLTLLLRKLLSPALVHRKLDDVRRQWRIENTPLIADHDYRPEKGAMPKEWYGKPVPVEFEGCMLMGVAKPHEYLTHLYGNYMEIPSEIPPQNYRFLDLNKPWREYVSEQKK
jgi:lipopolysaccharide cholinephosphotransferase